MAEESSSKPTHPVTPIVTLFAIMLILGAISYKVQQFFMNQPTLRGFLHQFLLFLMGDATFSSVVAYTGNSFLIFTFFLLKVFAILISIFMVWLIFIVVRKLTAVNTKLRAPLHPPKGTPSDENWIGESGAKYANPKWHKVQDHINSENPADWKMAILESDIILDEMLDKMGYHGETMGEKLKMVEPSDFTTIDSAWEAHKIRNSIAHEGSDFLINKREAERVIALYKKVFEEFKFI